MGPAISMQPQGFVIYAVDREFHLRRLARMLVAERVLTASLTGRAQEPNRTGAGSQA